jgi:NADH-quinone oxidoreductase subunit L
MVYAIGAGGIFASQFHLLSHAVFKALLFLSAGAVIHAVHTRDMREMGGLGRQMPFVRIVMTVGGLALAGIPVLNGFWSKELVLEAGHEGGPLWAWLFMLAGAGLTALYTLRFLSMVFDGERRGPAHVHDAGPAMKVALVPLALGTLTSWLLAGAFGQFLGRALPGGHEVEATGVLLTKIATAPATLEALAVVALGLAAWWQRDRLSGLARALRGVGTMASNSFGFEAINRGVVLATVASAESLRATHNGVLNWNILAILAGLVVILAILALGGARLP